MSGFAHGFAVTRNLASPPPLHGAIAHRACGPAAGHKADSFRLGPGDSSTPIQVVGLDRVSPDVGQHGRGDRQCPDAEPDR